MKKIFTCLFTFIIVHCALCVTNTFAQAGKLDFSFDPGAGLNSDIIAIAIQTDGKIIIGGDFTAYDSVAQCRIARLNTDGSLDTSFKSTGADYSVTAIAIQTDGKIIVGGHFTSFNGVAKKGIVRLNTDGSLDSSFNTGTGANGLSAIAIQPDGRILIGGPFTSYNGAIISYITRLQPNGALDTSYHNSFTPQGEVNNIVVLSSGKIIITGIINVIEGYLLRLNTDGSYDVSFPSVQSDEYINTVSVQGDGKILVGGHFLVYNGDSIERLLRLNADGSRDMNFNSGGSGPNGPVATSAIQPDGKIVIGGIFQSYNNPDRNYIARLNTDGTLDASFDPGNGASFIIWISALQTDGQILIGGAFTSYDGTNRNHIARVNGSVITGIGESLHQDAISIFPNPTSGNVNISCHEDFKINSLRIVNPLGEDVFNKRSATCNLTDFELNLPHGIYFVIVTDGEKQLTQKLIVQ